MIIKDKQFELLIKEEDIIKVIDSIALKINEDYKEKEVTFIIILDGAYMFASDLLKKIDLKCNISFAKYSSYKGTKSTGLFKEKLGIPEDIRNKNIIVIEDIVDTGFTIKNIIEKIKIFKPLSLEVAALFYKPDVCSKVFIPKYNGIGIPNDFIVGYGLDYENYGRNLKDVYSLI